MRLIRLHALQGDRARALHVYHTCATMLLRNLGVEPNEEIQTTYMHLLALDDPEDDSGSSAADAASDGIATRLIGRQAEWATLRSCWQTLKRRPIQMVVLSGEAGIGKTRLADELVNWAEHQGFATARARAYATEGELAYAPISDWLRTPRLNAILHNLADTWLSKAARLLPELLDRHPALPPPQPFSEGWQRSGSSQPWPMVCWPAINRCF